TANTAVAAFAAHIATEYAKTAAAIPPTTHANGSIQDQLSFTQPNAPWIFSPISGSFSIAPTSASPIGAISGVIFSISGNITQPKTTLSLSLTLRDWLLDVWSAPCAAVIICWNVPNVAFSISAMTS